MKGTAPPTERRRGDCGQVTVEFAGMLPVIVIVLVALWQCVLIGYTFTLAGNAADEGARAAAVAEDPGAACNSAATEHLPDSWQDGASISCPQQGSMRLATVGLKVPVLFPGVLNFPFTVTGEAGAAQER